MLCFTPSDFTPLQVVGSHCAIVHPVIEGLTMTHSWSAQLGPDSLIGVLWSVRPGHGPLTMLCPVHTSLSVLVSGGVGGVMAVGVD